MNEFEKALLHAAETDFIDVPTEEELKYPPIFLRKTHKSHTIRRTLIALAALIALAGSVFAAYVLTYGLGEVSVKTDKNEIFSVQVSDNNRYYQLTFEENFAKADAPDKLETYFLPTQIVSAKNLDAHSCMLERRDFMAFRPLEAAQRKMTDYIPPVILTQEASAQSDIDQILEKPTCVRYAWYVNGDLISFDQSLAVVACDGTPFVNHAIADVDTVKTSYKKLRVDEYSVFSFEHDFSAHPSWDDPVNTVSRTWYWSDGDYLFAMHATVSEEEMTELFRSVKPVSETFPYQLTDTCEIIENFSLIH